MSRRVAVLLAAASVLALAGCDGVVGAQMTFDDTEKAKVTDIVLAGGAADVSVIRATGTETRIHREIRGVTEPGPSYALSGSVLTLSTECGRDCHIRYQIETPPGVTVRGELGSGDVDLDGVGKVDLRLTSGDVGVHSATGSVRVKATSGDLTVSGAPEATLECTSGDLTALDVAGPVNARSTSGDVHVSTTKPASVTASVVSGDLNLTVPRGDYRIRTDAGSGDEFLDGLTDDPAAPNTLDLRTRSGDLTVTAG